MILFNSIINYEGFSQLVIKIKVLYLKSRFKGYNEHNIFNHIC